MKVTLNIENDAELRAYIKNCIKGQVLSVAREEIKNIIQDVFKNQSKDVVNKNIDNLLKEEIKNTVKQELKSNSYNTPSFIQQVAREYIEKDLKEAFLHKYNGIVK